MSITIIIVISLSGFYQLIAHSQHITDFHEDIYIAAKQVSQYVIGCSYQTVGEEFSYLDTEHQTFTIALNNRRLVKTPGFEILATDIEKVFFEIEERKIYMTLTRQEKDYRFLITYAKEFQENEQKNEVEQ